MNAKKESKKCLPHRYNRESNLISDLTRRPQLFTKSVGVSH